MVLFCVVLGHYVLSYVTVSNIKIILSVCGSGMVLLAEFASMYQL